MNKVLILGCGDVGLALARILSADGFHVVGARRSLASEDLPYRPVTLDVSDSAAFEVLDEEFDFVVYAVAADSREEQSYRTAYVQGVKTALDYFEKSDAAALPHFVFLSSTGVFGQSRGEWIDESSECVPADFTGALVLEGEGLVQSSNLPSTIVRFGGIYGPGRLRLINLVKSSKARIVENAERYTNRIHRDDCARMLQHILKLENPKPLYLGVDNEPSDASDVYRWLAKELGVDPLAKERWSEEELAAKGQGKRGMNNLIRAEGFQFSYPSFREGYQAILSAVAC